MHFNRGYAACCTFSVIACILYIVAIAVPDLSAYTFTFFDGNKTDIGKFYLGYFRVCRANFNDISNTCVEYKSDNNVLTGALPGYNTSVDLCQVKSSGLGDLQFCNKRTFVEAFTMVALFSSALVVAVCLKILLDDWCNGLGIYVPAVASMQAGLCGLIAMSVWASFLSQAPSSFDVGASFILVIFGWLMNFLAAGGGYFALVASEAHELRCKCRK